MELEGDELGNFVLCCICGESTNANPTNMCCDCLRSRVDITEGIARQVGQSHCRGCDRYERSGGWVACETESKELLAILLKRVRGLDKVHLVDASFVWTEARSKRVRVKLTVQQEIVTDAVLQATLVVEFVISNKQCDKCARVEAKDYWVSVVQVRQKVQHKRTMFWLEQLILKHNAHAESTSISEMRDGLDFFHGEKNHSEKLLSFLQTVAPLKYKTARQMITNDTQTGQSRNKFTFSVEIVPVCKDDLVCLPLDHARHMSNIHPLVLCSKVGANLHFMDPRTLQVVEMLPYAYWKKPFSSLCNRANLKEFVVLDVTPVARRGRGGQGAELASVAASSFNGGSKSRIGSRRGERGPIRLALAEVTVARVSDLGKNDTTFIVLSHLGGVLKAGDHVKGYDMASRTLTIEDFPALKGKESEVPEIVLVRKAYSNTRNKRRVWRLKVLHKQVDDKITPVDVDRGRHDYESFLQDLEEDPDMRGEVNLYKDPAAITARQQPAPGGTAPATGATDDDDGDELSDAEDVGLEELLDDLTLREHEEFGDGARPSAFSMPGAGAFHFT